MADRGIISATSGEWPILRRFVDERIEKLRDDLEQPGAGDIIRGEIQGLRWLIKQVEPDLPLEQEEGGSGNYR